MQLVDPTTDHIRQIMSWFCNQETLTTWAGPNVEYPLSYHRFTTDIQLKSLPSFCLVEGKTLLGFGQYYNRLEHIHLGRLVINPDHRGKGYIKTLIKKLSDMGQIDLNLETLSLFVFKNNTSAIKAYQEVGFSFNEYQGSLPLPNIHYMTKPI